jgi:hypothetical protein
MGMFFLGVCTGGDRGAGAIAGVSKVFRHMKHHYRLEVLKRLEQDLAEDRLEAEILLFYHEPRYTNFKRLYSQDRRPAKTVRVRPTVVALPDGRYPTLIERLRGREVAVEAVTCVPWSGWRKSTVGRAVGNDYRVSRESILNTACAVFEEGRLALADGLDGGDGICRELSRKASKSKACPPPTDTSREILTAVCLPVWFRETVPYRRSYRAR